MGALKQQQMGSFSIQSLRDKAAKLNWPLLVFLLLVLNVKLVVKLAAVIIICLLNWKKTSIRDFFTQRYLFFYFGMIIIAVINLLTGLKQLNMTYLFTAGLGMGYWMMCAVIAYQLFIIVKLGDAERLHNTISVFFLLHIAVVFIGLLRIMIETGSINPYTYMGMNVKYYMSTGDYISGITFDAPVTTAVISAFGVLYFLYRQRFIFSLLCMAALIINASNFTNLVMAGIFVFCFVFYSNRLQKSFIVIQLVMLIVFMAKISTRNYEHVGRLAYQVMNKPFDLPKVKTPTLDELKKMPDSSLTGEEKKKKTARIYIDSLNTIKLGINYKPPMTELEEKIMAQKPVVNEFKESPAVAEHINRYGQFIQQSYNPDERNQLDSLYNWKSPGKLIAGKQLIGFFKNHPGKMFFGNGVANFSSRLAFKATLLDIGGRYPASMKYIHPDFFTNHLYTYLYYHSKDQSMHKASNTPDSVYYQLAGEYGIAGLLLLFVLYIGYFLRNIVKRSYGLLLLFLLTGTFLGEYWFEQFSVVVLFELLFFIDMKDRHREGPAV